MQSLDQAKTWLRAAVKDRVIGVDRDAKVIRGYAMAEEGPFKSEGRGEFDRQAIRKIVRMANSKPAGLKSRFAHPSLSADGIGSFLGRARNAYVDTATREVGTDENGKPTYQERAVARADLHLDPTAFNTPNGNLGQYVLDLAESDPDALSSSLVLQADEIVRLDNKGRRQVDDAGKELPPLWDPTALHASDIVDDGDAVRQFLSADQISGLPDAVVRQASELLLAQFGGQPRQIVAHKLQAWVDRVLNAYWPENDEEPAAYADTLRRKLRMKLRQMA